MPRLTVLMFGEVAEGSLAALRGAVSGVEVVGLDEIGSFDTVASRELIRASALAAGNDWILLLRQGESVSSDLAREIATHLDKESAWGFRARRTALYCGKALSFLSDREGEIRLFHRRHVRYDVTQDCALRVEGAVVRLHAVLPFQTWPTKEAHRTDAGNEMSVAHHTLRFIKAAGRHALRVRSSSDLLYLWIEAGRVVR